MKKKMPLVGKQVPLKWICGEPAVMKQKHERPPRRFLQNLVQCIKYKMSLVEDA